jgi:molybdate transport system substrate-binding protein
MSAERSYVGKKNRWVHIGLASILVIAVLLLLLKSVRPKVSVTEDEIVVYCAAGIRLPVEDAANAYIKEYGLPIRLEYESSGGLEKRLQLEAKYGKPKAHLYIPANDFFAQKTAAAGLTDEHLPLARFKLVLATRKDVDLNVSKLDDLLAQEIPFVMCNQEAAVGRITAKTLQALGKFTDLDKAKKSTFTTVVEAGNAIKTAQDVQAGFIWDTTAHQFDLQIIELPELNDTVSTTSINLVTAAQDTAAALRFARYLAAPEKGNLFFERYHFEPIAGDAWAEVPQLNFFCGGVNRAAVEQSLREFEEREGVQIRSQFAGCGSLVSTMKSIKSADPTDGYPDLYLTCDKTFYEMVQANFGVGRDVSTTDVIILVRKDNPKNIQSLEDLARAGIGFGTTDPKMSTLGFLSWKILAAKGLKEAVRDNAIVTTPTAHELVTQMVSHPKLDAVLVYVANCREAKETCELIPIDHPLARATQNIGMANKTPYPALTERLINALHATEKSKKRFLGSGFQWIGPETDG